MNFPSVKCTVPQIERGVEGYDLQDIFSEVIFYYI